MNRHFRNVMQLFALAALFACQGCNGGASKSTEDNCCAGDSTKCCAMEENGTPKERVMTTETENFIFAEGKEWEPAGEGVVRQIMGYNDDIMVVKVKFQKGGIGAMHHHPHTQVTYVESGKFEFTINGVKKIVSAGDCLYKEPNVEHGCVCLEEGMLIDSFSPMRADFLNK